MGVGGGGDRRVGGMGVERVGIGELVGWGLGGWHGWIGELVGGRVGGGWIVGTALLVLGAYAEALTHVPHAAPPVTMYPNRPSIRVPQLVSVNTASLCLSSTVRDDRKRRHFLREHKLLFALKICDKILILSNEYCKIKVRYLPVRRIKSY